MAWLGVSVSNSKVYKIVTWQHEIKSHQKPAIRIAYLELLLHVIVFWEQMCLVLLYRDIATKFHTSIIHLVDNNT